VLPCVSLSTMTTMVLYAQWTQRELKPPPGTSTARLRSSIRCLTGNRASFPEDAEGFLQEGKTVLIAIGADHVYAAGGFVDLLTARGYQAEEPGGRD